MRNVMTEQERLSEKYREYRKSCGIVDPIMLDEIEEAYYEGMIEQKELMEANRIKHCDSITEEQFKLETEFVSSFIDQHNRIPTILDAIEYGMKVQKEQIMARAIDVTK